MISLGVLRVSDPGFRVLKVWGSACFGVWSQDQALGFTVQFV